MAVPRWPTAADLPHPVSFSPWDREGRNCLKLIRQFSWAVIGLRILDNTLQQLLSSGSVEMAWAWRWPGCMNLFYSESFEHCVPTVHDLEDCLSSCFCRCVIPKTAWRGKGLFHFTACSPLSREAKARTEAENMEECCLLACLVSFLIQPRGGTTHSKLCTSTSIINLRQRSTYFMY